jgi:hypothetical protein
MNKRFAIPENVRNRFLLLFEAARRSLLGASLLMERLAKELDEITPLIDGQTDVEGTAILPWVTVVSFVDFAYRYWDLLDALPGISKDLPEMKSLKEVLGSIEVGRHHLQHLRGDLIPTPDVYPLFGVLNWIREDVCYTMWLNTLAGRTTATSISFNRFSRKWTSLHQLTIKGEIIDLDVVLKAMTETYATMTNRIDGIDPRHFELRWGTTVPVRISAQQFPKPPSGQVSSF